MHRNESLLIAASYFWSDTLNAFVFGHGPASPTLADVAMLTGLDISSADSTHFFDTAPSAFRSGNSLHRRLVRVHSEVSWEGACQHKGTNHLSEHVAGQVCVLWSIGRTDFRLSIGSRETG